MAESRKTGNVSALESALGYDPGSLGGKDVYRLSLDNPKVLTPIGNEGVSARCGAGRHARGCTGQCADPPR